MPTPFSISRPFVCKLSPFASCWLCLDLHGIYFTHKHTNTQANTHCTLALRWTFNLSVLPLTVFSLPILSSFALACACARQPAPLLPALSLILEHIPTFFSDLSCLFYFILFFLLQLDSRFFMRSIELRHSEGGAPAGLQLPRCKDNPETQPSHCQD